MDYAAFTADRKTMKAVTADFTIIGEAAQHVPTEIVRAHPEVPWRSMRNMHNVVVHAYFNVEPSVLWETIQNDLPPLVTALESLLSESTNG